MTLILTTPPAREPLTLEEVKQDLRVSDTQDDRLLADLIIAARMLVESATHKALMTQSWDLRRDSWPARDLLLPVAPVQAITRVTIKQADGRHRSVPLTGFEILTGPTGRLMPAAGMAWPILASRAGGIGIAFRAGYGDTQADVPAPLRRALLMLVSHWYENREAVSTAGPSAVLPMGVEALLAPYKVVRL